MDGLVNVVIKQIENGNVIWLCVLAVIVFLPNAQRIYDLFERNRKAQIERLQLALGSEHLDGNFKQFMQEQIQSEYFRYVTGIKAERVTREALVNAYVKLGDIPFKHFERAFEYIYLEEGRLQIRVPLFERIWAYFTISFAVFLFIFSMTLITLPAISIEKVGNVYPMALLFILFAALLFRSVLPIFSSKILERRLAQSLDVAN